MGSPLAPPATHARRGGANLPGAVTGVGLLVAGCVLCVLSYSLLPWYAVSAVSGVADSAGRSLLFADLHGNADQLPVPVADAYFDRLAWGLLGIVVLVAMMARAMSASSPGPADVLRVTAFLTAVFGFVLTYYALAQLFTAQRVAGGSAHGVLHQASYGLYVAFAGWALLAAGSVVGFRPTVPRRAAGDTIDS